MVDKPLRFLVVDNHVPSRDTLKTIVTANANWTIVGETGDGQAAVAMTVTHHPDVVLMDIAMPFMNGLQAARQIKTILPEVKVILFSGYTYSQFRQGSKEAGADYFIQKEQITAKVLAGIIKEVLNH